jgi:hypothetical protein
MVARGSLLVRPRCVCFVVLNCISVGNLGTCRALASITGPVEIRQLIELPDRATLEVAVRPVTGVPGALFHDSLEIHELIRL